MNKIFSTNIKTNINLKTIVYKIFKLSYTKSLNYHVQKLQILYKYDISCPICLTSAEKYQERIRPGLVQISDYYSDAEFSPCQSK